MVMSRSPWRTIKYHVKYIILLFFLLPVLVNDYVDVVVCWQIFQALHKYNS